MKKVSFLLSLGLLALVLSCNKEATTTTASVTEKNTPLDKIGRSLSRSTTASGAATLALESGIEGGTADQAIYRVESLLNDKYSYADQSIRSIEDQETTLQFAMTNGSLSAIQVQSIYDAALNFWSQTYINYPEAGKIGLLLDLEKQATSTPSNLVVKVRASVGTPQSLGVMPPCTNPGFPSITFDVPFCNSTTNAPSNTCAAYHLTKNLNKKLSNNSTLVYFEDVHDLASPYSSLDFQVSTDLTTLNTAEITSLYCKALDKIEVQIPTIPAGYSLASIKIKATTIVGNQDYRFLIFMKIGKKKAKTASGPILPGGK
jgi:hypothetical protein